MGASVTLVTPAVAVEPGQNVSIEIRVRNTGTVVDEFILDVLGDAAGWAVVEPASLSLFPAAEGTAKAVFSPPRSATTPAGHVPFGLRARSREDPAGSAVEEGSVEVGSFRAKETVSGTEPEPAQPHPGYEFTVYEGPGFETGLMVVPVTILISLVG